MTATDDPTMHRAEPAGNRRVPPGPAGGQALRTLIAASRDRLKLMSWAAGHGDAIRLAMGPRALYFFNHPDHAKHVLSDNNANYHKGIGLIHARRVLGDGLLTSEGALWRKQRKVIQPVFQRDRIARTAGLVADQAADLVQQLREVRPGEPIDIVGSMTGLTLGVLGRTLLDEDLSEFTTLGHSFEAVQDQAMFEMTTLNAVPMWVPLARQLRFRRARQDLESVVDRLVERYRARERADGTAESDLLARLIASVEEETDEKVRRSRMRDEIVTLLLAGHETTASTLGWTWYLVGQHPEVFERLRDEARDVLGDRNPTYEDLHRLRYTTMVIEEVMRMYPPVWILPRRAQADDEVGGYHVPAGVDVLICPYTLHRHPAFWPRPDSFEPDRFDQARVTDRPRYAYIPFGAGPRFCVGNNLGMMEAAFVVAMIAREFRLEQVPGYQVVPEPMLSLRVRGGLPMTVHPAG